MTPKWGHITSGATFQSLVCTLLFFEDPKAVLFGRPGKDGAQDARSGDGTRVFQMKYHTEASAAVAIRDAKKEAATIEIYRQPGHARHSQWAGVKHWRLATNVAFNAADQKRWDDEVIPLFTAQGFEEVDLWEKERLGALLVKHPEVHRAYFENKTRAFSSVPEMRERVHALEPFLRRNDIGEIFGRTTEVGEARKFLTGNNQFLVIHGAGGIGKTRLLLEIGEAIASEGVWYVLWANVATMSATSTWYEGVVPERPTLLLVDEPEDDHLLKVLLEQLGTRASKWKVAITVRSQKDPVLRLLFGARIKPRIQELLITALGEADAVAMCESLLSTGKLAHLQQDQRHRAAQSLSKQFTRHPIWLTLAIQHLEEQGSLAQVPASAQELADDYLREIEASQAEVASEVVRSLIRWVALVGTVNREDTSSIEQLGKESGVGSGAKVLEQLNSLVKRRVLIQRGKDDRLVELKPDVLRDHVLLRWLSLKVGFGTSPVMVSDDAKALLSSIQEPIVRGSLDRIGLSKLLSLARTEFLLDLGGYKVEILTPLFDAIRSAIPSMSASQRVALAETLESVAIPQPLQVVSLIKVLRTSQVEDERVKGFFKDRVVGYSDVVLSLAWPLAHSAMGARGDDVKEAVLRELCAVAGAEIRTSAETKRGLPNDGKRAAPLVTRVLEGSPEYWGDFDAVGKKLSLEVLDAIATNPPSDEHKASLKYLVQPAIAIQRHQTWSDERAFHLRNFNILPDQPAWRIRRDIIERVKEILAADTTPFESRFALWPVFSEAHRELNFVRGQNEDQKTVSYTAELLADLEWAHSVLVKRRSLTKELGEARSLWDWHRRHGEPDLKVASERLEEIYVSNELAKEFEHLLSHDDWQQMIPRAKQKASALASSASAEEIAAFVERGARFIDDGGNVQQLYPVARELGRQADEHEAIRHFTLRTLGDLAADSCQREFAVVVAGSWVFTVREGAEAKRVGPLVEELLVACINDSVRVQLLIELYGRVPRPSGLKDYTNEEHAILRRGGPLFAAQGFKNIYIESLAITLEHDWPRVRAMLEKLVSELTVDERPKALRSLLMGVFWATRGSEKRNFPERLGEWLLDQLVLLPDFDEIGGNDEWHLRETLRLIGAPPVRWLPGVLAKRRALESNRAETEYSRAISHHVRISKYVQRITKEEASDPDVAKVVEELLGFIDDKGTAGYYLPEVLRDIDPEGLVVPELVAARAGQVSELEQVRRLARIGEKYVAGTWPWEIIAKAVLRSPLVQSEDNQRSIFYALGGSSITAWSAAHGEVPPIFVAQVESTKSALAAAADENLRSYWSWRVARAEASLREEVQRAKEARGE